MTRKETSIKEAKDKILRMKKEIKQLEERITKIESLPEFYENAILFDFEDFPGNRNGIVYAPYVYLGAGGIRTVYDLVNSSPQKILKIHGVGKVCLKDVMEWMDKHGLTFVD